ncbi:MAG: hypothetical protein JO223_12240 [Hyphomicrobiales bacterium]|nr:hypothetical protein [Hyphomicrobiales bacterium]MBV8443558.1 hypothetical protein [Hyphomicrobiales bacterium]
MATIAAIAASDLVTTISAAFLRPPPFDDALDLTVVATKLRAADPAMQWFRKLLREEAAAAYAAPGQ